MAVHALDFNDVEEVSAPQVARPAPLTFPIQAMIGALTGVAAILGTRVVLLLALIFAFVLSSAAQHAQSANANWSLGLFLAFGFLPTIYLATVRKV